MSTVTNRKEELDLRCGGLAKRLSRRTKSRATLPMRRGEVGKAALICYPTTTNHSNRCSIGEGIWSNTRSDQLLLRRTHCVQQPWWRWPHHGAPLSLHGPTSPHWKNRHTPHTPAIPAVRRVPPMSHRAHLCRDARSKHPGAAVGSPQSQHTLGKRWGPPLLYVVAAQWPRRTPCTAPT